MELKIAKILGTELRESERSVASDRWKYMYIDMRTWQSGRYTYGAPEVVRHVNIYENT